MLLALAGAVAAGAAFAAWSSVPLAGAPVVADVATLGALAGGLLALIVARLRRRALPWRTLLATIVLTIAAAAHFTLAPTAPAIVVMVVDCLRADHLTAERMPNTWKLAGEGARFTQARSQSSWTRSSMPSLLSGRYPVEHGLYRTRPRPDRIHADIPMLAELFSDGGWMTAAFAEQAQLDPAFGYARGFDRYRFHAGTAPKLNAAFLSWNRLFRTVPRFVLLHYIDAHGPYTPGPKFRPENTTGSTVPVTGKRWRTTIHRYRTGKLLLTEPDFQWFATLYRAAVRELDVRMARVYRELAADGTLDVGWIVVTADHGERFGEHGDLEHVGPPDEVITSVPLVIRPPGGDTARVVDDRVQHVDLAPTMLRWAGLEPPAEMPGRDLAPALRGEALTPAPSFAEEWYGADHRAAVRDGNWKLLCYPECKLFDLATDPAETTDLSAEHPDERARLESMLAAYFAAGEARKPIAGIDWAAAGAAGTRWVPQAGPASDDAEVSDGTMEALEALGYLDEEGEERPAAHNE